MVRLGLGERVGRGLVNVRGLGRDPVGVSAEPDTPQDREGMALAVDDFAESGNGVLEFCALDREFHGNALLH